MSPILLIAKTGNLFFKKKIIVEVHDMLQGWFMMTNLHGSINIFILLLLCEVLTHRACHTSCWLTMLFRSPISVLDFCLVFYQCFSRCWDIELWICLFLFSHCFFYHYTDFPLISSTFLCFEIYCLQSTVLFGLLEQNRLDSESRYLFSTDLKVNSKRRVLTDLVSGEYLFLTVDALYLGPPIVAGVRQVAGSLLQLQGLSVPSSCLHAHDLIT